MYVFYMYVCVYVYTYVYVCMCMYVCVCVCVCARARAQACQRIHDEIHDVCGLGDSPLTNPWLGFVTLPWTIGLGSSIRIALSGRQASILRDFGHACEGPRPWAAARFNAHMRDWLFWRYCCCEPMMLPGRTMRSQPMAYIRMYIYIHTYTRARKHTHTHTHTPLWRWRHDASWDTALSTFLCIIIIDIVIIITILTILTIVNNNIGMMLHEMQRYQRSCAP